jgi:hypothetical protein
VGYNHSSDNRAYPIHYVSVRREGSVGYQLQCHIQLQSQLQPLDSWEGLSLELLYRELFSHRHPTTEAYTPLPTPLLCPVHRWTPLALLAFGA